MEGIIHIQMNPEQRFLTHRIEAAVKILGGKILSAEPVKLPGLDDGRAIIKIAKIKSTPAQYPRKAGTPEKQPLGAK